MPNRSTALRELATGFLDLLLPANCAECHRALDGPAPLCPPCAATLPWLTEPPPPVRELDALHAAVTFQGAAEDWIHRFKYPPPGFAAVQPEPDAVVSWLARCAARAVALDPPRVVLPVPDHPRRAGTRGFAPAGILARAVRRELGATLARNLLLRVRNTESQTGFGRAARARNVEGAFHCVRPAPANAVLVDDVVTTGATLAAAAHALRAAGAKHVVAVCAAWTPPQRD